MIEVVTSLHCLDFMHVWLWQFDFTLHFHFSFPCLVLLGHLQSSRSLASFHHMSTLLKLHSFQFSTIGEWVALFWLSQGGLTLFWLCPYPFHSWVALFWLSQEGAYLILAMPFPPSHIHLNTCACCFWPFLI